MVEWMNEWMDERMNEWMNGRMNEWMSIKHTQAKVYETKVKYDIYIF